MTSILFSTGSIVYASYIYYMLDVRLLWNDNVNFLTRWLRENKRKVWDSNPTCRGPGDLGGRLVEEMTFDDLCDGQWASMVKLASRVPIRS